MDDISLNLNRIIDSIKNPVCHRETEFSLKDKLFFMFLILVMSFMFNFIFVMAIGTIEQVGLIDIEDHAVNQMFEDYSPMIIVLFAVILAPFFEELIFRAPLTLFCKYKKAFRWIFYAFALIFGYVHITNYELTTNVLLFSPILVGPQIILGLFLGVIRVKLGLIYAMFFHAFYNGILVIPSVLFQFLT